MYEVDFSVSLPVKGDVKITQSNIYGKKKKIQRTLIFILVQSNAQILW